MAEASLLGEGIERVESLRMQVAKRLRMQLRLGQLQPGTRLTEKAVADALGVSRTPAREALSLLGENGVLESLPNGGWAVPSMTHKDIDEMYQVRGYLEIPAIEHAVTRANPKLVADLTSCLSEMAKHVDEFDNVIFLEAVLRYRELLFSACENDLLSQTILELDNHTESMKISALSDVEVRRNLIIAYQGLVDAIASSDRSAAVKILKNHHKQGIVAYHNTLQDA